MKTLRLADILTSPVTTVTPDCRINDALALMCDQGVDSLVVVENQRPLGIFTERDALLLVYQQQAPEAISISEVMQTPLLTAGADMDYQQGYRLITEQQVHHLVIVDDSGRLEGIVALSDFLKHLGAEYELRVKEETAGKLHLQSLFETIPQGILENDCNGTITFSNPAHHRILGYLDGELMGKKIWDQLDSESAREDLKQYLRYLQAEQPTPKPIESVNIRKDGERIWLKTEWTYKRDAQGAVIGFTSVITDITEAKRAEEALIASEERYRSFIQNTTEGVYSFETDEPIPIDLPIEEQLKRIYQGYVVACNDAQASMYGYPSSEELMGMTLKELHGSDDNPENIAFLTEWIESDYRISDAISSEIDKNGNELWFSNSVVGVVEDGKLVRIWGSQTDISERKRAEQKLARANSEWTQALDQFEDAVYMVDMERHLIRANQAFYQMINSDPEHCVGQHIVDLIHPEGESKPCPVCRAQDSRQDAFITMEADDSNNPSGRPIEINQKLVKDDAGTATGMLVSLHDLTRSRRISERLRLSQSVFENTAEGIMVTDAEATVVEVNQAFNDIMGYSREEVIGGNPRLWKSGRQDDDFYRAMWKALQETGQWRGEIWNRRKDGTVFPEWQNISSVTDDAGNVTHYVSVFSDISQIKRSQEELDHLAHHDALTDLPNRLLLNERLAQAIKRADRHGTQLAVIFLDIDHFKLINDSFGHTVGDKLLQQVARYLQHTLRQEDTVSRLGGDEFVLLIEDVKTPDNLGDMVEKLFQAFRNPIDIDEKEMRITASLGISVYPRDGDDADTLLRNADAAMYRSKDEGRNTYQFYTEEFTRNAFERGLLLNSLRQAVEREELVLFYQPQVNLANGRFIGMEALLRWQHPELGMVSPATFIPLAEDSGIIHAIGEWVLLEACRQALAWLDRGIEFGRVAVNVSGPQIQRGSMVEVVEKVLAETGLPGTCLELEITEGFIMQEPERAISQLNALGELGIELAIDDFGTGYSSLSYLKQLPIHKLKIDQSFVRDIPVDPNDMAIAEAVIALGSSLGLNVIAEGVETHEQAEFLKNAGCQEAQGYLYSRPVPAPELETVFADFGLLPPR